MKANDFHKFLGYDSSSDTQRGRLVRLCGIVITGSNEAKTFTELPWVKKQFVDKLGIAVYPGTFNIMVLPDYREKLSTIRKANGLEITPENAKFCAGKAFPALVSGRIPGAAVIPLVPNYPQLKLEIVSSHNIRQTLALKDGDLIDVAVQLIEAIQD